MTRALPLLLALLLPTAAPAAESAGQRTAELIQACRFDEAAALLPALLDDDPWTPWARASWAFTRGNYAGALESLAYAPADPEIERTLGWLPERAQEAAAATRGMEERQVGDFVFRFSPGPDAVLLEYAPEVLQGERRQLEELLGVAPLEPTIVEFFPTTSSFVQASGLPREWVETTGTVAISKWDRLLVLSPRNLSLGYPWMDTLAHEYVHLAVARASRNRAPIWFHEGSARVLETAWRGAPRGSWRDPQSETLLARAVADDAWIPFGDMVPSMAALPSAEAAAQAFAQVAFAVQWLLEEASAGGYRRIVDVTAREGDVLAAIDAVLGGTGGSFEKRVERRLKAAGFRVRAQIGPIDSEVRDGAGADDPEAFDPILAANRAMGDHARLGDLLRLRGHTEAAVVEYERARARGPFRSPSLDNREARALRALGRVEPALALLREAAADYPEYGPLQAMRAELALQLGEDREAYEASRAAIGLNPFDPAVHLNLVELCGRLGDRPCLARERRALRALGAEIPDDVGVPADPPPPEDEP